MNTCINCEYYNSYTGRCDITGKEKDHEDSCKYHDHVSYDDDNYDWEH